MKTTNFEVSKKLKEIGFSKKSHQFYWVKYKNDIMPQEPKLEHWEKIAYTLEREEFPAYDLETLLEALPKINKQEYLLCSGGIVYLNDDYISVGKEKNESLADTAGKMWLLLKEKGLV